MNPYVGLSGNAFWRSAVADKPILGIDGLWTPKINIEKTDKIVTAGSCFAQHISRALRTHGYWWLDAEPAPPSLSAEQKSAFGFGVFSFRTGNIYTAALLKQWLSWALNEPKSSPEAWVSGNRVYDPFRPNIEPNGFQSVEEMQVSRSDTLAAIRRAVTESDLFVFTLGLTEAWINVEHGHVYPMCPGTVAGTFDGSRHKFHNYSYSEVTADLRETIGLMRGLNPRLRLLLTVSPVPLTATATGEHVLVATTYSKSTLRAVAGDLAHEFEFVDYFPSYEIITAFPYRGIFFGPNMRSVAPEGVEFVMRSFFKALPGQANGRETVTDIAPRQVAPSAGPRAERLAAGWTAEYIQCEEELLNAFGERP